MLALPVASLVLASPCVPPAQDAALMRMVPAHASDAGRTEVVAYPHRTGVPDTYGSSIDQLPGWPQVVPGHPNFAPVRGAVLADLDGDGDQEIVVSSTDGRIYAWRSDATPVPGFPRNSGNIAQSAPSIADMEGDGDLEIFQFSRGFTSGGRVFAWDHTGSPLPGYPRSFNNNNLAGSPSLHDLDDDGQLEVLVPERAGGTGLLHVMELDATTWSGNWPVALDHVPTGTSAVGDIDDDGEPEIVYLSYDSIYVLNADGTTLPGWPQGIAGANFSYQSTALVDLDEDGDLEIVVGAHQSAAGVYAYQHDGSLLPGWPRLVGTWTYCPPTVVDLEGDGEFEILSGREGSGPGVLSNVLWAWSEAGVTRSGFPFQSSNGGGTAGPVTIADLEGDGVNEIFFGHNIAVGGQGYLFGLDAQGQDLPGFPLRVEGFTYQNGASFGDVDGDGDLDLVSVSARDGQVWVNAFDLDAAFEPARLPWEAYHVKNRRGGLEDSTDRCRVTGSVRPGGVLRMRLRGEPGHIGSLWLGTATQTSATPFGFLYLQQPFRRVIWNDLPIPSSGQLAFDLIIPPQPSLIGLPLYWQGRVLDGQGGGVMTNLVGTVVQ